MTEVPEAFAWHSHTQGLITTGLTMGLLHVLAGPDHLSALAALAVGSSWKAFYLGVRWGLGHSTGLVVVAAIFISLRGDLDLKTLGRYCDFLVGVFMIALGVYGVIGALKLYKQKRCKRDHDDGGPLSEDDDNEISGLLEDQRHKIQAHQSNNSNNISMQSLVTTGGSGGVPVEVAMELHEHRITVETFAWCPLLDMHDPLTQRVVSFSIGLLHGVAGPGGILGVLPAVEMVNWRSSFIYLGFFIFASTLSMGTFAALYGELTKRLGATAEYVELGLSIFSSSLSIIVGTVWLVLSLLGKLDEIFH